MTLKAVQVIEDGKPTGRWLYCDDAGPVGYCATACNGHGDAQGAERHYREWQIDQVNFHADPKTRLQCAICGQWTNDRATLPGEVAETLPLCLNHQNHGALRQHYARRKRKS
jgi:hypothetical protein